MSIHFERMDLKGKIGVEDVLNLCKINIVIWLEDGFGDCISSPIQHL